MASHSALARSGDRSAEAASATGQLVPSQVQTRQITPRTQPQSTVLITPDSLAASGSATSSGPDSHKVEKKKRGRNRRKPGNKAPPNATGEAQRPNETSSDTGREKSGPSTGTNNNNGNNNDKVNPEPKNKKKKKRNKSANAKAAAPQQKQKQKQTNPTPTTEKQQKQPKQKRKGRGKNDGQEAGQPRAWWRSSEETDPITMEPIAKLRYPPFELQADESDSNSVVHLFDGKVLAQYIVSTGTFQNPNNRQEMTRDTCRRLDEYLRTHRLSRPVVTESFDLSQIVQRNRAGNTEGSSEAQLGRQAALRREATVLLQNMFQFGSVGGGGGGRGMVLNPHEQVERQMRQDHRQHQRQRDRGVADTYLHREGNFAVVDGDDWVHVVEEHELDSIDFPDLASGIQASLVETQPFTPPSRTPSVDAAPFVPQHLRSVWGSSATTGREYPTLRVSQGQGQQQQASQQAGVWGSGANSAQAAAAVRAPPPESLSNSRRRRGGGLASGVVRQRPLAEILAQSETQALTAEAARTMAEAAPSSGSWRAAPASLSLSPSSFGLSSLNSSSSNKNNSSTESSSLRMMPTVVNPEELLCPYTPEMLAEARELGLSWVMKMESRLYHFVHVDRAARTMELGEMSAKRRKFMHVLCTKYWALETVSRYWDPHRELHVNRTAGATPPEVSVAQAMSDFIPAAESRWKGTTPDASHAFGLWGLQGPGGSAPRSALIHAVLEQYARMSEYSVRFVDDHNAVVEFALVSRARKTCSALRELSGRLGGGLSVTRVQWWPAGTSWAAHQLDMRKDQERSLRVTQRQERRVMRQAERANERREELQTMNTAWDDSDDEEEGLGGVASSLSLSGTGAAARTGGQHEGVIRGRMSALAQSGRSSNHNHVRDRSAKASDSNQPDVNGFGVLNLSDDDDDE